jgi:uncharacterized protein YkwD
MRISRSISVLTLTALVCLAASTAKAAYSDVSSTSRYAVAIDWLSDAGVIKGYPDGSFLPQNPVNRAEFLKLALESSDIPADVTEPTVFTDIDEKAWYAKYVRKAYAEGWIQGYGDGTFRPQNPISKAEGLKMIGEMQEWELPPLSDDGPFGDTLAGQWFTPYIAYAKTHNFLEESGRFFIPDALFTREKTAEVLFRTSASALNGSETYYSRFALIPPPAPAETEAPSAPAVPETGEEETVAQNDFTPVPYSTAPADFFEDVTLTEPFPNTFYLNELYYFEGTSRKSGDKAFVFLIPEGVNDSGSYINHVADMDNGRFRIPVYFRAAGNYRLGLIPGNSGESKVINISVLSALPAKTADIANLAPSSPQISYGHGKSTVAWDGNGNGLIRVRIAQATRSVTFIFRQGISAFDLPYAEFKGFGEGTTEITVEGTKLASEKPLKISGSWKKSGTTTFTAVNHEFTENDTSLKISSLPETYSDGQSIYFSGTNSAEIFAEAAVTKPDGTVEMIGMTSASPYGSYYSSDTIPAGGTFTFRHRTSFVKGTYFIEINGTDGEAVLNYPVYLKNTIPLAPDFVDLASYEETEPASTLTDMRAKLLKLINADRTAAGLKSVANDAQLNNLAQLHSEDMVNRDFFGHINPDGESPEDRRIEFGYPAPVGENLAQAPTISYAHQGLMRSGIHRMNILDPAWKIVGLGIAEGNDGYLFFTEEFSAGKLTEIDFINLENEILERINKKRAGLGLAAMNSDPDLAQIADDWSTVMAEEDFFDFTSPDGASLDTLVRERISNRSVQAQILESSDREKIAEEVLASAETVSSARNLIGIGIKADNIGNIKATILYSTY